MNTKPPLTDRDRDILTAWLSGGYLDVIGRQHGMTANAVYQHIRTLCDSNAQHARYRLRTEPRSAAPETPSGPVAVEFEPLDHDELQTLQLLAARLNRAQIAAKLGAGQDRVRKLVASLLVKLDADTPADAVAVGEIAGLCTRPRAAPKPRTASSRTTVARDAVLLRLLQQRASRADIAATTGISRASLSRTLSRLYARLGVRSAREAVLVAEQHGLFGDGADLAAVEATDSETRRIQVLCALLDQGAGMATVAAALHVSKRSAQRARARLCQRFNVTDPREAVERAIEAGLYVPPTDQEQVAA